MSVIVQMFRMISAVLPGCVPISGVYNIKMCQEAPQQIFAAVCAPKAEPVLLPRTREESTKAVRMGSERYQDSSLRFRNDTRAYEEQMNTPR
jgi:hypothetical protein